jgi:chorismate mutase/prephenate dehydratase
VQTASTSAAAREAAGDPAGAAVGSSLAGELYGLPVLYERIQDRAENATRFVVIGREDAPRTGDDKTTLGFALRDEPGALMRALAIFDAAGVNLSRIESRPSQRKAWEYVFLVDVEGHREDAAVAAALARLRAHSESVTLLGSYPRHAREGEVRAGAARGGDDDHRSVPGG